MYKETGQGEYSVGVPVSLEEKLQYVSGIIPDSALKRAQQGSSNRAMHTI